MQQGDPEPAVFSHAVLLKDPERLLALDERPRTVRIDATGEDEAVERALLLLGYDPEYEGLARSLSPSHLQVQPDQRGAILAPRQRHRGFLRYLARLEAVLARRPAWRLTSSVLAITELFDKRVTSSRWQDAGIPVPEAAPGVADTEALLAVMTKRGWTSAFVKVSSASSASCLAVVRRRNDRLSLQTTIRRTSEGWFNSLRVHRVDDPEGVQEILTFLLNEGAQVERNVPKARLDGAFMDVRVLCIAGEPTFWVTRQARHIITNLHLGGWRGDSDRMIAAAGEAWSEALDSCRRVAAMYDCLQLGLDVMFEPGFRGHRLIEGNAFGDLLPNLTRDGLSVYEWQVRAAADLERT